jgi:cytochrome c peroxidase
MKGKYILILCFGLAVTSFRLAEEALFKVPEGWPPPVYHFENNPLTKSKIQLGRALFYDPTLSRNNIVSCASCHSPYNAFTHADHALSHGIEDRIGTRNSSALMNLAWQKLFMRDGAVNHLDMQALAPISNPVEMDESLANVVLKLQSGSLYPDLFYEAFGDSVITGEHTLKAISQFLLTLVSSHSKYDSVMLHQAVFTVQENNGYQLFRQHCSSCHTEPLFTNDEFMNNGLKPDPALMDVGRYKVTLNPEDLLKFKVPSLRNIEFSYPYMHDGRFRKLSQVLDHYTTGIVESNTLADTLRLPIILTSNEKVDLVAFLLTLTDRSFLFNPQFSYPKDLFFPVARD